jgi:hypothetical protein
MSEKPEKTSEKAAASEKVRIRRTGASVDLVRHEASGRQMSAHRIETGKVLELSQADAELHLARDAGQWEPIGWKPRDGAAVLADHDARLAADLAAGPKKSPEEIQAEQEREAKRKADLDTPLSI